MKPQTHYYREAVAKVAQAIDDALHVVVRRTDADEELVLDDVLIPLAEARAYIIGAQLQANLADRMDAMLIDVPDEPMTDAEWKPFAKALDIDDEVRPIDNRIGDNFGKPKLPKLKPQGHDKVKYKPGVQKLFKGAINYECPTCHAEANTNCFQFSGPGKNAAVTTVRNDGSYYHGQRVALAKAYNDRIRKQNIAN